MGKWKLPQNVFANRCHALGLLRHPQAWLLPAMPKHKQWHLLGSPQLLCHLVLPGPLTSLPGLYLFPGPQLLHQLAWVLTWISQSPSPVIRPRCLKMRPHFLYL